MPRRRDTRTVVEMALQYLEKNPGKSSTQIANELKEKSGTVSGLLSRLCNEKVLGRSRGLGPRGGYGYFLLKDLPKKKVVEEVVVVVGATLWARLLLD